MRHHLYLPLAVALFASAPAFAQHERPQHEQPQHEEPRAEPPRANGGHIPAPPVRRTDPHATREVERTPDGRTNEHPHVNNDHWYGHAEVNDRRLHLDHPFEHGHFAHVGPSYRYSIARVDLNAHRFWLPGGFYFEIAAWDWPEAADWCWTTCPGDFVVYEDPDHPGWYLVYNTQTGVYVHAQYLGG